MFQTQKPQCIIIPALSFHIQHLIGGTRVKNIQYLSNSIIFQVSGINLYVNLFIKCFPPPKTSLLLLKNITYLIFMKHLAISPVFFVLPRCEMPKHQSRSPGVWWELTRCKTWIVIVAIWEDTMNLGSRFTMYLMNRTCIHSQYSIKLYLCHSLKHNCRHFQIHHHPPARRTFITPSWHPQ